MVLANIASRMFYTLLPVYLADLGASVAQIGLIFSAASLFVLLLQLLGGWISDTIGRLRAIAVGSVAAAFGYFIMPLSPNWGWALLALCLEYISGALVGPSFGAFLAEQSSEAQRGRVYGLSTGIFQIVGITGGPLAGFLAYRWGFRWMLLSAAVLYALASLVRVWMALTVPRPQIGGARDLNLRQFGITLRSLIAMIAGGGILAWILLTDGATDLAFRLSEEMQPLYFSQIGGLDVRQIGVISSVSALGTLLSTWPSGWLADRLGERVPISAGFLLQGMAIMIFLASHGFWGFAFAVGLFGAGSGLVYPAFGTLISKVVPQQVLGSAFGLFSTSIGLISLPGPWAAAQLWTHFSPRLPFQISGLLCFLCAIPAWFKFRLTPKEELAPEGVGG